MKVLILALCFIAAQAVHFDVPDKDKNVTCLMLNIDGDLTIAAEQNGTTKGNVTFQFSKAELLLTESNCTAVKLNLGNETEVWLGISLNNDLWNVTRSVKFNSKTSLGVNVSENVTADADELIDIPKNQSYLCNSSVTYTFKTKVTSHYNYTVVAAVNNFQIQAGGIHGGTFTPGKECDEDKTSTTPSSTTVTTTPAPTTTTAAPKENDFFCNESGVVKFRFEAKILLVITYESNNGTNKTVYIDVPLNATSKSTCDSETEETLNIIFSNDWALEYVFKRSSNTSETYYVSNISLTYSFNDSKEKDPLHANYSSADEKYLSANKDGYYICNSNSSTMLSPNVKLYTSDLKYKAFNAKGDISLTGDGANECAADEGTSSVVPIAVGAALAGLVVIVLIAYLIGRRRSRKAGYESV